MQYSIPDITAEQIVITALAVYYSDRLTAKAIGEWLETPEQYAERAAQGAKELGIIKETTQVRKILYEPVLPLCKYFAIAKVGERPIVFKQQLMEYEPFRFFKDRLLLGEDPASAAKHTKALYSISANWNVVKEKLSDWGSYAGILSSSQGKLGVAETSPGSFISWEQILDRATSTADYVIIRIGDEAANIIGKSNFDKLVALLAEHMDEGKPPNKLTDTLSGVVESIFSDIAKHIDPNIDLSNCQGLNQLFDKMRSENILAKKHLGFTGLLGQLRNAVKHEIDHQEQEAEWEITRETSRYAFEIALSAIRSVIAYSQDQHIL